MNCGSGDLILRKMRQKWQPQPRLAIIWSKCGTNAAYSLPPRQPSSPLRSRGPRGWKAVGAVLGGPCPQDPMLETALLDSNSIAVRAQEIASIAVSAQEIATSAIQSAGVGLERR